MKDDIYYNRSHYYDPTAGKAITNIERERSGLKMAQDYAKAFYGSKAWENCRNSFMKSKYFICERCGGVAVIAHHKRYITPKNINNPELTLSWNNLESLCIDCHNSEHGTTKSTAKGISFDSDGKIIYTPQSD